MMLALKLLPLKNTKMHMPLAPTKTARKQHTHTNIYIYMYSYIHPPQQPKKQKNTHTFSYLHCLSPTFPQLTTYLSPTGQKKSTEFRVPSRHLFEAAIVFLQLFLINFLPALQDFRLLGEGLSERRGEPKKTTKNILVWVVCVFLGGWGEIQG